MQGFDIPVFILVLTLVLVIASFVVIFGINTMSDVLKLSYVIS